MVQVYKEPFAKRHYAGWFSTAVFYRLVAPILAIIVSFVVALTTGDMWVKNNVYLEQPSVKFGYDLVLVLETTVPGQEKVWTTFEGVNRYLAGAGSLLVADVQAAEQDYDKDGLTDVIDVRVTARGIQGYNVHSVKMLMTFDYQLNKRIALKMQSLAYLHHSSPVPGAALYADGDLVLRQKNAILDMSMKRAYTKDIITWPRKQEDMRTSADMELQRIFQSYLDRNETTVYQAEHPVWVGGREPTFLVNARVRVPTNQPVVYKPNGFAVAKFGWIQFLSMLAVFYPLVYWSDWVVFHFRILKTRVVSDLQPKTHRF